MSSSSLILAMRSPIGSDGDVACSAGLTWTDASSAWMYALSSSSCRVDAGDPSILDADGTTSDIGAYGGPEGAWP